MRLAYIISAYKLPDLLVRLVDRLQSSDATFVIHVDKKSPAAVFSQMQQGLRGYANVHFLKRHLCYWGDFGHVQASLEGISELLAKGLPFDYAILLTGQDYPIKNNSEIAQFFTENNGKSFINHISLPNQKWQVMHRIESWHYHFLGRKIQLPFVANDGGLSLPARLINLLLPPKRSFLPDLKPHGGSSYWNLTREALCHIADFLDAHPDFIPFFKKTLVPDELFFQTILLNSPRTESLISDSLRYVDWADKGKHPAILGQENFNALRTSPKLFARKFDPGVDSHILDMIDHSLL